MLRDWTLSVGELPEPPVAFAPNGCFRLALNPLGVASLSALRAAEHGEPYSPISLFSKLLKNNNSL